MMRQGPVPVLHLNAPLTIAGAERVILNYLDFHDRERFRIVVAPFINEHNIAANPFPEAVCCRRVECRVISICRSIDIRDIGKVVDAIRKSGSRIIHTHGYRADIIGLIAARLCRIRAVATVHGWTPVTNRLQRYEKMDRRALRHYDRVIAVSEAIRQGLLQTGLKAEAVVTINNAVPLPQISDGEAPSRWRATVRREFGLAEDDFVVGVIGRLSEEKGVRYFLEALSLMRQPPPRVRGLIVGDGPEAETLRECAHSFGLGDAAVFAGFRREIPPLYAAVDCIALPSLTEGIPMVVLEAFAHGRPIVATRVGGVPEIVTDGRDGLLVESCQPEQMAEKIRLLADDSLLRELLVREAHITLITRFDPLVWAGKIEKLYNDLLVQ